MEVLEGHRGHDLSGPIFYYMGGSLNFSDVLFGCRGVHSEISH